MKLNLGTVDIIRMTVTGILLVASLVLIVALSIKKRKR